jgi:hypothetical protein
MMQEMSLGNIEISHLILQHTDIKLPLDFKLNIDHF